jgi:ribosomal protein S18 acetylase RimI-like enzyme
VLPEARGLGVGRALGEAVSELALRKGYPSIVTDWRETNLQSSRAWRGLGYRDTFTRVHRLIGH